MQQPRKYRIVLYNVEQGLEITVGIRGDENYSRAREMLMELLALPRSNVASPVAPLGDDYFAINNEQLAAFQSFVAELDVV